MMHEFEAMLFSECTMFASGIGRSDLADGFQNIRDQFGSPEEINDSFHTAPSKRILKLMPEYNKVLHGNIAAIDVGLETIRSQCPNFSSWMNELESLR
jgi:hypothetical protein